MIDDRFETVVVGVVILIVFVTFCLMLPQCSKIERDHEYRMKQLELSRCKDPK